MKNETANALAFEYDDDCEICQMIKKEFEGRIDAIIEAGVPFGHEDRRTIEAYMSICANDYKTPSEIALEITMNEDDKARMVREYVAWLNENGFDQIRHFDPEQVESEIDEQLDVLMDRLNYVREFRQRWANTEEN